MNFCELPLEIHEIIGRSLDNRDYRALRRTSKLLYDYYDPKNRPRIPDWRCPTCDNMNTRVLFMKGAKERLGIIIDVYENSSYLKDNVDPIYAEKIKKLYESTCMSDISMDEDINEMSLKCSHCSDIQYPYIAYIKISTITDRLRSAIKDVSIYLKILTYIQKCRHKRQSVDYFCSVGQDG